MTEKEKESLLNINIKTCDIRFLYELNNMVYIKKKVNF